MKRHRCGRARLRMRPHLRIRGVHHIRRDRASECDTAAATAPSRTLAATLRAVLSVLNFSGAAFRRNRCKSAILARRAPAHRRRSSATGSRAPLRRRRAAGSGTRAAQTPKARSRRVLSPSAVEELLESSSPSSRGSFLSADGCRSARSSAIMALVEPSRAFSVTSAKTSPRVAISGCGWSFTRFPTARALCYPAVS
jgi:hypothetical protein